MNWTLNITVRSLLKERSISLLNLSGLTIGFAIATLIFIYVYREFSVDNFHENIDEIYLPETSFKQDDGIIDKGRNFSMTEIQNLRNTIAGVDKIAFLNYSYFNWDYGAWIEYNGDRYEAENMAFTDSRLIQVFSFNGKEGDLPSALEDPGSIVLTESMADKIFKRQNPIGEIISLNGQNFAVKAVIHDPPQNSSIIFSGLLNYKASGKFLGEIMDDNSYLTFFLLNEKANVEDVTAAIHQYYLTTIPFEEVPNLDKNAFSTAMIPFSETYFNDAYPYDVLKNGNQRLTWILLLIGILILSLALINYINLSIAGSFRWVRSYSVQRIFGLGLKGGSVLLILRSMLLCITAFIAASFLIFWLTPFFNKLINYPVQLSDYLEPKFILIGFFSIATVALISGMIPGLIVDRISPAMHLKGLILNDNKSSALWKRLLVFQMIISIVLISVSFVIFKQMRFATREEIGINTENMVLIPVSRLGNQRTSFIDRVKGNSQTIAQCLSSTYLNSSSEHGGILNIKGEDKTVSFFNIYANQDFVPAMNLRIIEGRNFFDEEQSDLDCYLINEAAKNAYGLTSINGAALNGKPVVGVFNNYNFKSFRYAIEPMAICKATASRIGLLTVHFRANSGKEISDYIRFLQGTWQNAGTDVHFEYEFISDRISAMYVNDKRLMDAILSFTLIAVFISSLGLFGIILFETEKRTKEIGIRKVNGANVSEVIYMLNKDFVKWVGIAFVIATPIAYYAMNKWLQNFAYRTGLSWWIFGMAGLLALGIALLTVSWQSYRAASRNPVEALRYE